MPEPHAQVYVPEMPCDLVVWTAFTSLQSKFARDNASEVMEILSTWLHWEVGAGWVVC